MSGGSSLIRLKAFPMLHEQHTKSYRIWAKAELNPSELRLHFKLEAAHPKEFARVILPEVSAKPTRKSNLWNETCFECFIPAADSEAYLEVNGSPSGDWNFFAFKGYRSGMTEFSLGESLEPKQTVLSKSDRQIESEWVIPLTGIRQGFLSVGANSANFDRLGLTAVLNTNVATTYWALAHEGVKPDFHLGSSFTYPIG